MENSIKNPKFAVLGGGTGSFNLLSALKFYVQDLTALVNMADDGGSTGQLRDEYGVLPPGDVRQCLVALSSSPRLRDLFNFRFPGEGELGGHTFGNLFLSALELNSASFAEAIKTASEVLRIQGSVIPITLDDCRLVYEAKNGQKIFGETNVGKTDLSNDMNPNLRYEKPVSISGEAAEALQNSDMIIIAPGSLYTSLIPLLLVEGTADLLQKTRAKIVYVANLVNKPGETDGYTLTDYVTELERYAGKDTIDAVLYNTAKPSKESLGKYMHEGEYLVDIDEDNFYDFNFEPVAGEFLSRISAKISKNDKLAKERSLIRHDAHAVSRALMKLYYS